MANSDQLLQRNKDFAATIIPAAPMHPRTSGLAQQSVPPSL